jgi:MSHA biogenesis protein MshL
VLLEGKIVEVMLNDNFQAGINWAALLGGDDVVLSQTGGGSILDQGTSNIRGTPIELNRGFDELVGTATEAFGGMGFLALNLHNFKAFIELLKTQGDVRVLSSPRVATMNNQKAVIKVGTDEFFVTGISVQNTALSAGNNSQAVDITIRPFFSGIAFDVTPQISDKNEVTLHIHPTVSDVKEQTKLLPVSVGPDARPFPVPLAFSSIRESDNVVKVQNNQVVVIGGLMKDAGTNKTASTPLLGDLPLIGPLFRHQLDAEQKSELVIMLRPTIVSSDATPDGRNDRLKGYDDRLKGYYDSLAPADQEMPRP